MQDTKTERLLNLVICLLATRRFLSVQQIREAVPGYSGSGGSGLTGKKGNRAARRYFSANAAS